VSALAGIIIEAAVYVVAQGQELLGQRQTDAFRAACTDLLFIILFICVFTDIYLFVYLWAWCCRVEVVGSSSVPVMITLRPGGRL
jgi:hypothetical protein